MGPPIKESYDDGNFNFGSHLVAGVRAGYQWGPWRIEEEYSYRHNVLYKISFLGSAYGDRTNDFFHGSRNSNTLMTNLIYDFSLGWPVTPHIGAGLGAVHIVDTVSADTIMLGPGTLDALFVPSGIYGGELLHGSSNWQFGYQAIAGVRYI